MTDHIPYQDEVPEWWANGTAARRRRVASIAGRVQLLLMLGRWSADVDDLRFLLGEVARADKARDDAIAAMTVPRETALQELCRALAHSGLGTTAAAARQIHRALHTPVPKPLRLGEHR